MTSSLFAANYELRHIASDDVIFDTPQMGGEPCLAEQGICHIDAAYGGDDYTAFTIARKKGTKYYLYGRLWHKHVDDCMNEIIRLRKSFNAGRFTARPTPTRDIWQRRCVRRENEPLPITKA